MKNIVIIGSSNVDTTLHVKNFPKPGETINARSVSEAGGGKGANQAIAAAKSGAQVHFISRVGTDSFGKFMVEQLTKYGVDTNYVQKTANAKTGHAYITLNEAGQNDIVIDHGANYQLSAKDIDNAADVIKSADCVIAQFETPVKTTIEDFKIAKDAGKATILNPAPAIKKIPKELLNLTDIITPNETESAVITGTKITSPSDLTTNAASLQALGVKDVVITYGAKGSYLSAKDIEKLVPAFRVKAVDTTAAGDTFIGYFVSMLKNDLSNLEEAAKIASRASSLTVQHLGAQPSIPTIKEVKKLMRSK